MQQSGEIFCKARVRNRGNCAEGFTPALRDGGADGGTLTQGFTLGYSHALPPGGACRVVDVFFARREFVVSRVSRALLLELYTMKAEPEPGLGICG